MFEKDFGGKMFRATTRRKPYASLAGIQEALFFVVTVDGTHLCEIDPELEPPKSEEEAVEFVIQQAKSFLSEQKQKDNQKKK